MIVVFTAATQPGMEPCWPFVQVVLCRVLSYVPLPESVSSGAVHCPPLIGAVGKYTCTVIPHHWVVITVVYSIEWWLQWSTVFITVSFVILTSEPCRACCSSCMCVRVCVCVRACMCTCMRVCVPNMHFVILSLQTCLASLCLHHVCSNHISLCINNQWAPPTHKNLDVT